MPSFAARVYEEEMMDDYAITDERLTRALENLRGVNRFLGGHAATMAVLKPFLRRHPGQPLRILDIATGIADFPEELVRWADGQGLDVQVVAIDANPVTVDYAGATLQRRLPAHLRQRIQVAVEDALALPYEDGAFDVVVTSLFMHHLRNEEAVALLRAMGRIARHGLLVNDLHRHPLAYYGIRAIGAVLPVSAMFRHDGPLSVLRAFTRAELEALAWQAGLAHYSLRWHWAFRWILTTLERTWGER